MTEQYAEDEVFVALNELDRDVIWQALDIGGGHWGGPANDHFKKLVQRDAWLKARVGVQGSWDMTGSSTPAEPSGSNNVQASSAKVDDDTYTMTPVSGASQVKLIGGTAGAKTGTLHWAKFAALATGGNIGGCGIAVANASATAADVAATIASGSLVGTCTHLGAVIYDVAGVLTGAGTIVALLVGASPSPFSATAAAGNTIHVGLNYATGKFSVQVGAGSIEENAAAWDISGLSSLRPHAILYFAGGTISFPQSTFTFDLGDTAGGRTPFGTVADPTPPEGAADGKSYLVSVAGSYAGRSATAGDIVTFHSDMAAIQVQPATPMTTALVNDAIAAYMLANPAIDLLTAAQGRARLLDVANDTQAWSPAPIRGDVVIVGGAPTGDFTDFTAGNPIVYDGSTWQEYEPDDFAGVSFATSTPGLFLVHLLSGSLPLAYTGSYGSATSTAVELNGWGWCFYNVGNAILTTKEPDAATSGSILLNAGTHQALFQEINGDSSISFGTFLGGAPEYQYLRVENVAVTVVSLSISGQTYRINPADYLDFFMLRSGGVEITHRLGRGVISDDKYFGSMRMAGNSTATTITSSGVFVQAAGATTAGSLSGYTHASGVLTPDGMSHISRHRVTVSCNVSCATANQAIAIRVAKGGVDIAESEMVINTYAAGEARAGYTTAAFEIADVDGLSLYVANLTGANDVTVTDMNFRIEEA